MRLDRHEAALKGSDEPDAHIVAGEELFDLADAVLIEMEDAGGEGGVGVAGGQDVEDVLRRTRPAAGDDGNFHRVADGGGHLQIVPGGGAVGIHHVQDDLAGAKGLGFFGPFEHVDAGADAAAVDEDFPAFAAVFLHAVGIEAEHRCLPAKFAGDLRDQFGRFHRGGIDADFFRAGLDEPRRIVERADPSADAERHEDLLDYAADEFGHDLASFMAGGDVVEDQFISAVGLIALGLLDGVAGIDVVEKFHAFDDAAAIDIETGNDALGEHGQ